MRYKLSLGATPYLQDFACAWQKSVQCYTPLFYLGDSSQFISINAKLHILISLTDDLCQHSKEGILDNLGTEQK